MGWNDSRISLLAPGWKMVSEEDSSGVGTVSGMPLRILHSERVSEGDSTDICPEAMQSWLEEYGFEVRQLSEYGNRLQWEDVEANLGIEDGALAEVVLTFTLTRNSPLRLHAWESLVHRLSKAWGLGLYSSDLGFCVETDQFTQAIARTPAWRDFATNFKWSTI